MRRQGSIRRAVLAGDGLAAGDGAVRQTSCAGDEPCGRRAVREPSSLLRKCHIHFENWPMWHFHDTKALVARFESAKYRPAENGSGTFTAVGAWRPGQTSTLGHRSCQCSACSRPQRGKTSTFCYRLLQSWLESSSG
jgi:hypothetical protein